MGLEGRAAAHWGMDSGSRMRGSDKVGWRLSACGTFLRQKESPTVMLLLCEGIPTNIQQPFLPHGEMAQKTLAVLPSIGWETLELRNTKKAQGQTEMVLIYRCFKNLTVNLRVSHPLSLLT